MLKRVRLGMEALEAREVPAAFSFQLPDGRAGAGTFSTPGGVDAAQATQSIALTDLTVTLGGQAYTVQSGATASYAYGMLTGVMAAAVGTDAPPVGDDPGPPIGGDEISLSGATVTVGTASAAVAFDAADTEATFELSDGTAGALSYDLPWDSVDPTQASQSLSLTNFVLNIAGKNLTPTTATFTTSPTAQFVDGEFVGLSFAVNTAALSGFPYTAVSMTGLAVTAQVIGGQTVTATAAARQTALVVNFTPYQSSPVLTHTLTVKFTLADGTNKSEALTIPANASATTVQALVLSVLKDNGLDVTAVGGSLLIKGTKDSQIKRLDFDVLTPPDDWAGPAFGGQVSTPDLTPQLFVNGKELK